MHTRDLLNRLADAEEAFVGTEFVAPVVGGGTVQVRVAGIVCRLKVTPPDHQGWAVLQAVDHGQARVVRAAGLAQVREYLALFPAAHLVLCERRRGVWHGLSADDSDRRLRFSGPVPVLLAGDVQLFDTVRARFDGTRFLFEAKNPRRDPAVAAYLQTALSEGRRPDELAKPTLTRQERTAYAWQVLLAERRLQDATEERLRRAVAHADGEFRAFLDRGDSYTVTYVVDGRTHTSAIRKEDLSVLAAGICLSGEDQKFDLASLVGVIREGQDGRLHDWG